MPYELHPNNERRHVDHGWLKTAHSFSFAHYVNRNRMNVGALLVLNEDTIAPNQGFGEHFHDNMEIITIPLSGALEHRDSMGNGSVIHAGDVQIMSAGTGIMHSERNPSPTEAVHLLQIWITPRTHGLPTRYDQKTFSPERFHHTFAPIVTPTGEQESLIIHQRAQLLLGKFDLQTTQTIPFLHRDNTQFIFIIQGSVRTLNQILTTGDAIAIHNEEASTISVDANAHVLVIDVPSH